MPSSPTRSEAVSSRDGGPEGPRKSGRRWWRSPYAAAGLLVVGFVLLRLPFRARYLVNWDAVNFALGVRTFDLAHHQPHPPGYIGYVLLGRGLDRLTGDPNAALTLLSVVAGAVAPAVLFLLARRFMSRRSALLTAVLFGTSPIVWYYSSVALSYMVEVAIALPFVLACYEARTRRSFRHLLAASVLLAVSGAIRQTSMVLMTPLWLYAAWPFPMRRRLHAGLVTAGTAVLWLVPLVTLSGGPAAYLRLSSQLAELTGGRTWIFSRNPVGVLQNLGYVLVGMVIGLNVALLVLALAAWFRPGSRFRKLDRRFLLLWALPPLATFLLIHTGQLGYVLVVLPIGFLWAGALFEGVMAAGRRWLGDRSFPRRRVAWLAAIGVFAAVNVAGFLFFPAAGYALVRGNRDVMPADVTLEEETPDRDHTLLAAARQLHIPANDAHWRSLFAFISTFDPEQAVVLTDPANRGSFRHTAYYLPEYRVYGLGKDLRGTYGHLFSAHDGRTDYQVEGLNTARRVLRLPEQTRWLLIPDPRVQDRLEGKLPMWELELRDETVVAVAILDPGTSLTFLFEQGVVLPRPDDSGPRPD